MWSTPLRGNVVGATGEMSFFSACLLRQQDPRCDDFRSVCRRTHRVCVKRFLPSKHFKADKSFLTSLGKYARPNSRFFPRDSHPIRTSSSFAAKYCAICSLAGLRKKPGTVPYEDELCLPCKPIPSYLLLLNMRDKIPIFSSLNERSFFIQNPFGIEVLKCSLCSLMLSFSIIALLGLDARTQAAFWTTILSLNHQLLSTRKVDNAGPGGFRTCDLLCATAAKQGSMFCITVSAAHKQDI